MSIRCLQLLCCSWILLFASYEIVAFSWNSGSVGHRSTAAAMPTRKDLFALKNTPTKQLEAQTTQKLARHRNSRIEMRDRSCSYWFSVGDRVRVVDDVLKGPKNLNGRIGKVVETWEKCDVDPTCCCAEQVDTDMAVRVIFEENEQSQNTGNNESAFFYYYFAEEELVKL